MAGREGRNVGYRKPRTRGDGREKGEEGTGGPQRVRIKFLEERSISDGERKTAIGDPWCLSSEKGSERREDIRNYFH